MADEETRRRLLGSALRLAIILTVGGLGLWVVIGLDQARRAQNCIESGDRRCRVIQDR